MGNFAPGSLYEFKSASEPQNCPYNRRSFQGRVIGHLKGENAEKTPFWPSQREIEHLFSLKKPPPRFLRVGVC